MILYLLAARGWINTRGFSSLFLEDFVSVNVEFKKDFTLKDVRSLLNKSPGITVLDNPSTNTYPMPVYAHEKDDVFVGRIRRDESTANTLNMRIVADNLRKGAATNAIQIAEYIVTKIL